jgi:hypothetical protein
MGTVKMEETAVGHDPIYTIYLYCERCGSFSIAKRLNLKMPIVFLIISIIAIIFGRSNSNPLHGLICFGFLVLGFFFVGVFDETDRFGHNHGHICRKCGNRHIELGNSLHYPEWDKSKIDVVDRLTHKHYYFDAFPHPEIKLPFQ